MQNLGELFGIDTDKKINRTEALDVPTQFGEGIEIVNKIYAEDFKTFDYEKIQTASP